MPNHSWTQSRMLERATAYAVSHPCIIIKRNFEEQKAPAQTGKAIVALLCGYPHIRYLVTNHPGNLNDFESKHPNSKTTPDRWREKNQAAFFRGLPRGRFAETTTLASSSGRFLPFSEILFFLNGFSLMISFASATASSTSMEFSRSSKAISNFLFIAFCFWDFDAFLRSASILFAESLSVRCTPLVKFHCNEGRLATNKEWAA